MNSEDSSGTDSSGRGWTERGEESPGRMSDRGASLRDSNSSSGRRATNAREPVVLERTMETSQFSALFIGSVIAFVAGFMFLVAPDLNLLLRIFMIAIVLLSLRFWGGVLVLVAVQADLFFRETKHGDAFSGLVGILTVFLILTLLMFINRNRSLLQRAAKRPIAAFFTTFGAVLRGEMVFDSGKAIREIPQILGAAIRGSAILMGTIFVSRILLSSLPTPQTFNQNLRAWMTNEAFIPGCSLLLGSIVALWIMFNETAWRQMTREQARIYLRSVLLLSHHADLRMIVRGRLKSRRQVARQRKDVDAAPGQLNEKNFAGLKP